jgi:hypothetical protein
MGMRHIDMHVLVGLVIPSCARAELLCVCVWSVWIGRAAESVVCISAGCAFCSGCVCSMVVYDLDIRRHGRRARRIVQGVSDYSHGTFVPGFMG